MTKNNKTIDWADVPSDMLDAARRRKAVQAAERPVDGDLRIWWIPQVGSAIKPFHVHVRSLVEAHRVLRMLGEYDLFQFENRIKPDYANTGGLEVYIADTSEWVEWYNEESGDEVGDLSLHEIELLDEKRIALMPRGLR